MTNDEVNKIIAEYMGITEMAIYYIDDGSWCGGQSLEYATQKCANYKRQGINCELRERVIVKDEYTESLDSLVPVWEKLKKECNTEMIMGIQIFDYNGSPWNCEFETQEKDDKMGNTGICIEHPSSTAFESAAHTTAKAIISLGDQ